MIPVAWWLYPLEKFKPNHIISPPMKNKIILLPSPASGIKIDEATDPKPKRTAIAEPEIILESDM
jgi:hypothetical protein